METSQHKALVYTLFLFFLLISSNITRANECSVISNFDKIEKINQSCWNDLSPSDYYDLISIITESSIDNHILKNNLNSIKVNYDKIIIKTIELYERERNKKYSDSLLKLLEMQKLTTLQDYFEDDCTPLNNEKIDPASGEAILYMHSLSKNKLLILLIVNKKIFINYSQTNSILEDVLGLKKSLINPLFKTMHYKGIAETENNPLYNNIKNYASSLYDELIRPFSKHLSRMAIDHLVVIPDSSTGIFPIETLFDAQDGKYVLDKDYSISYSPNLSKIRKKNNKRTNLLFVSPESPEKEGSGFNKDLELIENLLPVSKIQGDKATKLGLFNAITNKPMSILYVASHAKFEKNFADSHIQLSNTDKLLVKDFERMTSSLTARAEPPELIVLSACETAQSDGGSIDASLGLAGVAARSGANTVIASLWVTRSPEALLGRSGRQQDSFFQILKNDSYTKAKALQESKKRLKKSRSIYEWAPFVLIGDWGNY